MASLSVDVGIGFDVVPIVIEPFLDPVRGAIWVALVT